MESLILTTCCYMRLRTAGLVIGGLHGTASVLSIIINSLYLSSLNETRKLGRPNGDKNSILRFFYAAAITFLLTSIMNLVTDILLVVGILKDRHKFLQPWLIFGGIYFITSALHFLGMFLIVIGNSKTTANPITLLFYGLGLALQLYCLCAIFSLYKEIQSKNDARHMPPTVAMRI